MAKTQQPLWTQELSARYRSGIAHAFLIHGNIQDYVGGIAGQSLKNYLLASFADRTVVVYWHRAGGLFFPKDAMKKRFAEVVGLVSAQAGTNPPPRGLAASMNALAPGGADPLSIVDQLGRQPLAALNLLNHLLHVPRTSSADQPGLRGSATREDKPFRAAVILDYAETLVPATDAAAPAEDRTALVTLTEWGRDASIGANDHILVMITSELHDLNERLRKSGARWEQIEIPFPSFEERRRFAAELVADPENRVEMAPDLTYDELARLTTGLRYIDIEDIVLRASFSEQPISQALVKARKDEIMASEFEEVLQVVEADFGFESVGGLTMIKDDLRNNVITPMRHGQYRLVPQGILLMGPAGTGKTKLTRALAKEAGVTFVELQPSKIFSKWVGDTERRLERALSAIRSMTPCIVFIDELDQAMGRGESGDSGVSNRVFKRLMEIMSDTAWRGKIVWVAASNRPDLLDAALLRPGRLDKKIPILAPDTDERAAILAVLTQEAFGPDAALPSPEEYSRLAEQMEGYTGAEIEGIVGKASQLKAYAGQSWSIARCLQEAYERIVPSTRDIEAMTHLALTYCNDLDLVPAHLRELARRMRRPVTDEEQPPAQLPQNRRRRGEL